MSLDRSMFINEEDLIVWSKVLIIFNESGAAGRVIHVADNLWWNPFPLRSSHRKSGPDSEEYADLTNPPWPYGQAQMRFQCWGRRQHRYGIRLTLGYSNRVKVNLITPPMPGLDVLLFAHYVRHFHNSGYVHASHSIHGH